MEERNKWFEEGITFMEMNSRWDSMELKKGSVSDPLDSELNRKWAEFERVSFRDMTPQSLIGTQTHQSGYSNSSTDGTALLPHSETYQSRPEENSGPPIGSQSNNMSTQLSTAHMNGDQTAPSSAAEALQKEVGCSRILQRRAV